MEAGWNKILHFDYYEFDSFASFAHSHLPLLNSIGLLGLIFIFVLLENAQLELFVLLTIILFNLVTRTVDLDMNRDVNLWTKRMVTILLAHLFMMLLFNGNIYYLVCFQ